MRPISCVVNHMHLLEEQRLQHRGIQRFKAMLDLAVPVRDATCNIRTMRTTTRVTKSKLCPDMGAGAYGELDPARPFLLPRS